MSLVLQNSKGKSSLVNIIDTPGHVNFADEVASIARLVDGVVLVVDVVEGVMHGTEAVIRHAMQEKLKLVLVVNKMDRLILELRLPPSEAFFKIKHTIEEVNSVIAYACSFLVSPELTSPPDLLIPTTRTDYHRNAETSPSPRVRWAGASPFEPSPACTPTLLDHSMSKSSLSVCGATSISTKRNGNFHENRLMSSRSDLSSTSSSSPCISCTPRSV